MEKKKILITAGGTGGHIIPAIALYNYLKKKGHQVIIVSDTRGEKFLRYFTNLKPKIIRTTPLFNKNVFKFFYSLSIFFFSFLASFSYLNRIRPDLIFGMGGYSSFPICISAKFLGIDLFVYENNLLVGKTNKILLRLCKRFLISYKDTTGINKNYLKKVSFIGNILREKIINYKSRNIKVKKKLNILILGGSQAAKVFGEKIPPVFKLCKLSKININIYQQCLISQNKELNSFYKFNRILYKLFNFEKNILKYYKKAHLVITRSGSSVTAELINCNIPFISIPLETSADSHQMINANYLKKKGLCYLIRENEIDKKLFSLIKSIHKDKSLLSRIIKKQKKINNIKVFKKIEDEIEIYS